MTDSNHNRQAEAAKLKHVVRAQNFDTILSSVREHGFSKEALNQVANEAAKLSLSAPQSPLTEEYGQIALWLSDLACEI